MSLRSGGVYHSSSNFVFYAVFFQDVFSACIMILSIFLDVAFSCSFILYAVSLNLIALAMLSRE